MHQGQHDMHEFCSHFLGSPCAFSKDGQLKSVSLTVSRLSSLVAEKRRQSFHNEMITAL